MGEIAQQVHDLDKKKQVGSDQDRFERHFYLILKNGDWGNCSQLMKLNLRGNQDFTQCYWVFGLSKIVENLNYPWFLASKDWDLDKTLVLRSSSNPTLIVIKESLPDSSRPWLQSTSWMNHRSRFLSEIWREDKKALIFNSSKITPHQSFSLYNSLLRFGLRQIAKQNVSAKESVGRRHGGGQLPVGGGRAGLRQGHFQVRLNLSSLGYPIVCRFF